MQSSVRERLEQFLHWNRAVLFEHLERQVGRYQRRRAYWFRCRE